MMAEDWMTLKLDTERNIMMKRARTARLIVICGYVLMILAFTVIIVFPCFGIPFRRLTNLTDRDKPLPLQTYYFYDTDKSPQFEFTIIIQGITIFLAAITYTSVDAFLGLTILHICGQLENYRGRLANLVSGNDFNNALRSNVNAHLRLIRFADKIEDTFTLMMLGLVFYFDFMWAIELNRLGLELIGLWPKTNGDVKNTFISDLRVGVIFFIVTVLSIIPLLCSLVRVWGDMILIVDNLQVTLPLLVVSLKLIVIRWKRTAIVLLVKMMAEDWMKLKIDAERNVMISRARTGRLIVICGFFLMIFVFTVLIILPAFGLHFRYITNLTDQGRLLPFQAYYFYNTDMSPQFELALMIQATTMFLGATTYTSVDAFLGLLILHICGQLENFKHRLINLTSCKDFDTALRNNVQTHLRIIRFASNIEDAFTLMMLGLVFYFGIVFCLFGFLFVTVITGNEIGHMSLTRICFLVIGIFTLLAHTFLYCGAGEIIAKQKQPGCCTRIVDMRNNHSLPSTTSGVSVFALVFGMDIAKHSQYKDFAWAIKLNRLGLELIGLWPKNDEVPKNNFSSDLRVVIIFVIVTFISGIPLTCSLIRVWGDMILMVDNLQVTLPLLVLAITLKQGTICDGSTSDFLYFKALLSIIKMMAEDWMELKTRKERDVMMRRAQIARIIVISGYILMVLAFILVIILPYFGLSLRRLTNLTDPGKPLPLQTYYFYDINKSPQFELTYIVQAITIFLAAVTYTSVDAFLGFSILHFSGQLENFKNRIFYMSSNLLKFLQVDFEWAVKLNRIALDIIGLWPKTAKNTRQKLMCNFRVLMVFLAVTCGVLIPSIHSLIKIYGDIMLMLDNLQFTLPAISCSIRIMIFWWKKEAIIPIMNMIAEDWTKSKNIQDRNVMIRRAYTARIIITCAYCIMGVACFFIIILPSFGISMRLTPNITDPGKPMPLQTYYIYDITKRPQYEITFCNEIYYAAYNNEWYSVDPKIAKDLLLLLVRGAKPVYLTAGKIFPMTMATFCGVMYFNI
ncbi:PREDICTED: uncharacterized protein LOC108783456 [Cyphomyrmex costatus]|uniref:uncharacterized protein LOC108783456 n=1 Tax=Cyphomyrmex costatus TaxID=456900 RepID=UPI00085222D6|nr:PREDICTED: uncharacterized protein LOC108783456 [Cyphomyrmex costatus]